MAWEAHPGALRSLTDGVVESEVKYYEEECHKYNEFRRQALQGIQDRLSIVSQYAANIDILLLPEPDCRTMERAQLRWRAYEATKSVMEGIEHEVDGGTTLRLLTEHKTTSPRNQDSSLSALTRCAESGSQTEREEDSENQPADSGFQKEKSSRKTSKRSRVSDTDSDDEIISRNPGRKRKKEPPSPQSKGSKKPRHAGPQAIHIEDVEDTFIFEYPHNSSLLWIAYCSTCGRFQPKRHPLISTNSVLMHWSSKDHELKKPQEVLEDQLIQVLGGTVEKATEKNRELGATGKTECQASREEVFKYKTPEWMHPLLPRNKHRERRTRSRRDKRSVPGPDPRLRLVIPEPPEANKSTSPPRRRQPGEESPWSAGVPAENSNNVNGLANLLRQPLLRPPTRPPNPTGPNNASSTPLLLHPCPTSHTSDRTETSPRSGGTEMITNRSTASNTYLNLCLRPKDSNATSTNHLAPASKSNSTNPKGSNNILNQTGGRGRDISSR